MRICDAVRYAMLFEKCIALSDFPGIKMKPEGEGLPLSIMHTDGSNKVKCWDPTPEELVSNKWILVD